MSTEVTKHSFHSSRKMHEMTIVLVVNSPWVTGRKVALMTFPSWCRQNWMSRRRLVHSSFDQPMAIWLRSPWSLRTALFE